MKKITLFLLSLIVGLSFAYADSQEYIIGEQISFKSEVLDEERSIIVYTPATYETYQGAYPVLYLLDGGTHFHHATGIVQFLSARGLIPEMIVVAVQNVDRTRDFSPTQVPERPATGGAKKFMAYLEKELIPFIHKNYRAVSYDILMGHSFGGEFATYALLNRPEVFDAYIAISPYMMYDNSVMIEETKAKLKSSYKKEVQFYMTVGNEPDYFATLSDFENIVQKKSPKNFKFSYRIFEDDNHNTVPHLSIYYGLESIYSGWKLPKEVYVSGLAAIDNHFKEISKKYGYEIVTPEGTINQLGYYYLNKKDRTTAIQVFTENVNRYPASANVYDSLGEAYENNDQLTEASENYQKAYDLAKATNHPNLSIYEDNLKRSQRKLAQN